MPDSTLLKYNLIIFTSPRHHFLERSGLRAAHLPFAFARTRRPQDERCQVFHKAECQEKLIKILLITLAQLSFWHLRCFSLLLLLEQIWKAQKFWEHNSKQTDTVCVHVVPDTKLIENLVQAQFYTTVRYTRPHLLAPQNDLLNVKLF